MRKLTAIAFISLITLFSLIGSVSNIKTQALTGIEAKVDQMLAVGEYDSTRVLVTYKDKFPGVNKLVSLKGKGLKVGVVDVEANIEQYSKQVQYQNEKVQIVDYSISIAKTDIEKANLRAKLIELLNDAKVLYAEPNYLRYANAWNSVDGKATPQDFDAVKHWYYDKGKVREMWEDQTCPLGPTCGGDSNVTIAVLDTGVAAESYHDQGIYSFAEIFFGIRDGVDYTAIGEDYTGSFNLWENPNETPNNNLDDDCNGVIDDYHGFDSFSWWYYDHNWKTVNPTCTEGVPTDYSSINQVYLNRPGHPVDTWGHGSFVAGNIAGQVDNAADDTVSPGFNLTIMPIAANIHYYGSFWNSDILNGVDYAVVNGADVVNLSLGGSGYSQIESDFFQSVRDQGVLVVASSGNSSGNYFLNSVAYPAAYSSVISVGAIDQTDDRAYYSNGGSNLDLTAYVGEGNSIGTAAYQETLDCAWFCDESSTYGSTQKTTAKGTSFASPQVAAAAGIIISNNPGISVDEIEYALKFSTTDLLENGFDNETGWGVLDFQKANNFVLTDLERSYFPVYRYEQDGDRKAWINMMAPDTNTDSITVTIEIAGELKNVVEIAPGESARKSFIGEIGGPVVITSNGTVHSTLETRILGNPNEFPAIHETELDTSIYYPAYRHNGDTKKAWLLIGNPDESIAANVEVYIGGNLVDAFSVSSLQTETKSYISNGDSVEIRSDIPIFSTQKYIIENGGNEMAGLTLADLGQEFYFPTYTHKDEKKAWILVTNPSEITTATVDIYVGTKMKSFMVDPGDKLSVTFPGIHAATVRVVADTDVYTSLKINVGGSPNEMEGIKAATLSQDYYYPRYTSGWIVIVNPNDTLPVAVDVTVGDTIYDTINLAAGQRYTFVSGVGPEEVSISADGLIYTAYKYYINNQPSEYPGLD